jgi:hypothetical protein
LPLFGIGDAGQDRVVLGADPNVFVRIRDQIQIPLRVLRQATL